MGQAFGNLTRTEVQSGGAAPKYYDDPTAAAQAAGKLTRVQPTSMDTGLVRIGEDGSPTGPVIASPDVPAPKVSIFKPTFQSQTTDGDGNSTLGPGLTKRGVLLGLLKSGVQGGMDAIQGGGLNAVPGQSSFGAGFQAADNEAKKRVFEGLRVRQLQNEAAIQENNLKNAPLLFQQNFDKTNSEIADNKARAGWYAAGSDRRSQDQFKFIPGVGLKNLSTGEITDKVPAANIDPKTETQLRYAAAQGDTDAQAAVDGLEASRKTLKGTPPGKAPSVSNTGPATVTAAKLLQRNNGDVNATLSDFNAQLANSQNSDLQRDAPLIIRAIKAGGGKGGAKKAPAVTFNNAQAPQ